MDIEDKERCEEMSILEVDFSEGIEKLIMKSGILSC